MIEEELARLNDYCVAVSQAIHNELAQQQTVRQELEDGPEYHESDDGPIHRSEILLGLDDIEIPRWQEVNNFMMPATQILLLNVLVERSLKSLCAEYDPETRSRVYGGHTARELVNPQPTSAQLLELGRRGLHTQAKWRNRANEFPRLTPIVPPPKTCASGQRRDGYERREFIVDEFEACLEHGLAHLACQHRQAVRP